MTPEQALQLLDSLASQVNMTRAQHTDVLQAVSVLRAAITPQEK